MNGYNLAFAVIILTAAAAGDRLGRRNVFAAGIALFTVASAASALAPGAARSWPRASSRAWPPR